jgi:hypothetical protein
MPYRRDSDVLVVPRHPQRTIWVIARPTHTRRVKPAGASGHTPTPTTAVGDYTDLGTSEVVPGLPQRGTAPSGLSPPAVSARCAPWMDEEGG